MLPAGLGKALMEIGRDAARFLVVPKVRIEKNPRKAAAMTVIAVRLCIMEFRTKRSGKLCFTLLHKAALPTQTLQCGRTLNSHGGEKTGLPMPLGKR